GVECRCKLRTRPRAASEFGTGALPQRPVGARGIARLSHGNVVACERTYMVCAFARNFMAKSHARELREAVRQLMVAHGTFEEAKRPCGTELPMPHAYALLDLLHHGQPMTVSELAARL